mmetsp:Transcript_103177/g.298511  ORF Transcript_103177/g.298511 Transcript_103177/m.298511 type:complete len:230 (-) Transcript_103177:598-1287(-)
MAQKQQDQLERSRKVSQSSARLQAADDSSRTNSKVTRVTVPPPVRATWRFQLPQLLLQPAEFSDTHRWRLGSANQVPTHGLRHVDGDAIFRPHLLPPGRLMYASLPAPRLQARSSASFGASSRRHRTSGRSCTSLRSCTPSCGRRRTACTRRCRAPRIPSSAAPWSPRPGAVAEAAPQAPRPKARAPWAATAASSRKAARTWRAGRRAVAPAPGAKPTSPCSAGPAAAA